MRTLFLLGTCILLGLLGWKTAIGPTSVLAISLSLNGAPGSATYRATNSANYQLTGSFTLECWIRATALQTPDVGAIYGKNRGSGGTGLLWSLSPTNPP